MKYAIDHDYHIHSKLSICSNDPEQTTVAILAYAEKNGFKDICLTDHFWDEKAKGRVIDFYKTQDFEYICRALPLPQGKKTKFHFGCETEQRDDLVIGLTKERMDKFDFIIIPTTHFHWYPFISTEKRISEYITRLDSVLDKDLPFEKTGIAHLACSLIAPNGQWKNVIDGVPDGEYHRLFNKAAKIGVGIEINASDFGYYKTDTEKIKSVLRVFKIAKEEGCKFYLGSDAHHIEKLNTAPEIFAAAIEALALTEEDKFRPFR